MYEVIIFDSLHICVIVYRTASMSTNHPDVIKQRVKSTKIERQNMQAVQRIRAKGEASATTRKKRENKDLIRSDGIWGWDNEKL